MTVPHLCETLPWRLQGVRNEEKSHVALGAHVYPRMWKVRFNYPVMRAYIQGISVQIVRSPVEGLSYSIEVSKAVGPVSDTTRVFAHLERGGKSKKILVLDGSDITISKITWNNPHDVSLCLLAGITSTFRNQGTLIVGDTQEDSVTIHNHLDEHCAGTFTTSPNASN
jgi:hypothetical protein